MMPKCCPNCWHYYECENQDGCCSDCEYYSNGQCLYDEDDYEDFEELY